MQKKITCIEFFFDSLTQHCYIAEYISYIRSRAIPCLAFHLAWLKGLHTCSRDAVTGFPKSLYYFVCDEFDDCINCILQKDHVNLSWRLNRNKIFNMIQAWNCWLADVAFKGVINAASDMEIIRIGVNKKLYIAHLVYLSPYTAVIR